VSYTHGGTHILVGGSDHRATLCTREGVKLAAVATKSGWVWCCKGRPGHDAVGLGCDDGSIDIYNLQVSYVQYTTATELKYVCNAIQCVATVTH
jgi:intraflagellar transport protein 122